MNFLQRVPTSSADLCRQQSGDPLSQYLSFQRPSCVCVCVLPVASNSGMGVQESTAQQMVSDPTLVHVLVRFLSGGNPHGTSQHSSQVPRQPLETQLCLATTFHTLSSVVLFFPGWSHCHTSLAGILNPVAGAPVFNMSPDVQRISAQAVAHLVH